MSRGADRLRSSGAGAASGAARDTKGDTFMTVQRLEHIGIVVDDLPAATAFFSALGLEPEGEASVSANRGSERRNR